MNKSKRIDSKLALALSLALLAQFSGWDAAGAADFRSWAHTKAAAWRILPKGPGEAEQSAASKKDASTAKNQAAEASSGIQSKGGGSSGSSTASGSGGNTGASSTGSASESKGAASTAMSSGPSAGSGGQLSPGTSASSNTGARPAKTPHATPLDVQFAPVSARIILLPFLLAGHECTLSVVDAESKPLNNVGVYIDEELFATNAGGTVTFTIPDADSFEISLMGEERKKIAKRKFHKVGENVLAENDRLAETALALLKVNGTTGSAPFLAFAPTVMNPGDEFVLLGHNFSEKIPEDLVSIDGNSAQILSASSEGLLGVLSSKTSIGPLRQIYVSVNGQNSNTAEVDIATPFFSHVKTESDTDELLPESGKIGINGSNVPCLIRVVNNDIENASLWSPTKEPLGKNNILLTPGGDQNYLNIDLRMLSAKTQPKVDLSLVHELSSNPEGGQTPPQLLVAACRAEIMRLERRRIAVAYKLDEVRNKINTPPPGASPDDIEKTMSDGKALSLRLRSIDKMLSSRKAIFESLGATDAQYRQTIDDAAGGANFSLDLSTKPVQILSDIGAGSVGSDLPKNRTPKKGRLLRMLEPVIRLLPPMTDEERAAMQASRASTSSYPADVAVPTPTTPDGLQLRPSLPEPEPEVSDTSRGRRVAPAEEPKKSKAVNPWKKTEEENAKKASAKTAEKKSAVKGAKGKSSKSPTDAKTGKSKKGKKAAEPIPTRTQSKRSKQSTSASKKKSALVPASSTSHRRRRHN